MDMNAAKNLAHGGDKTKIVKKKLIELRILSDLITEDHLKPKTSGSAGIDLLAMVW